MKKYHCIIPLFLLIFASVSSWAQYASALDAAQKKYAVYFADKPVVEFDPFKYFSPLTIEKRIKTGIPLHQFSDLPVSEVYISELESTGLRLKTSSRWMNMAVVFATSYQIEMVKEYAWVSGIELLPEQTKQFASVNETARMSKADSTLLFKQLAIHQADQFAAKGMDGTGIRIAVFDAGFPSVDELAAFDHLHMGNKIIATYDFVKDKAGAYRSNEHGTQVLSNITGIHQGQNMGMATDATFLLARTERALLEPHSEEENWLVAAEWADKNGAHIISSSLGYTDNRYERREMNGQTALVTRAANMAASKGILVVNAMGNSGSEDWKIMGAPGDADSVLTVGGVDPNTGYHISFSSFGPTAEYKMKPNVCGAGHAVTAKENGKIGASFGTSFATPLVAGFVAAAWEAKPSLTNMELFREIEKSGHLFPYYDYAHGFGIPQASYFVGKDERISKTLKVGQNDELVQVLIDSAFSDTSAQGNLIYYHFGTKNGQILEYGLLNAREYRVSGKTFPWPDGAEVFKTTMYGFVEEIFR